MLIQITKQAVEYLAQEACLEPDYAEELLQNVITMCMVAPQSVSVPTMNVADKAGMVAPRVALEQEQ